MVAAPTLTGAAQSFASADACADAIIERVGRHIRIAVPIGIGKPIHLLNALYRRVERDQSLSLKIFTGLTLVRPPDGKLLQRRFLEPLLDRCLGTTPSLLYADALRGDRLPANIEVNEFFLQAGAWLRNDTVQRSFTSLNYSNVAAHLKLVGINVLAQLVAPSPRDPAMVSLSASTDVALDMRSYVDQRRSSGEPIVVAGELNANLPFMPHEAEVERSRLDVVLEPDGTPYELFAPPKEPVSLTDYAIALRVATLVKDGGTLQIGIGSLADALAHALILRHRHNDAFRGLVAALHGAKYEPAELPPFATGLYGCSEMLGDSLLALKEAGVLARRVTDRSGNSALIHAGFFLGNHAFYRKLREMPECERREIVMTAISFTNTLHGDAATKLAQRSHARFVNTTMTATLLGAVSSDALESGATVSGVGGQLDLVAMAQDLPGARSIIALRSTRWNKRQLRSNIVWQSANLTVPRALRDICVTEHGIADLRGRSDRDTIVEMLRVADRAAQPCLMARAKRSGKLERGYRLPDDAMRNTQARVAAALEPARQSGLLPLFPLGTEMTPVEQQLVGPLTKLKNASWKELAGIAAMGLDPRSTADAELAVLDRLGLTKPGTLEERLARVMIRGAVRG